MLQSIFRALGIIPQPQPRTTPRSVTTRLHAAPAKPAVTTTPKLSNQRMGADMIAIIGFTDKAFVISLPAEAWGTQLAERVKALPAKVGGGGTNIAAALRLGLQVSRKCPPGSRRRFFLLSDGEANCDTHDTEPAARAIADVKVNLNCIAFGDAADSAALKRLAGLTHNGKFIPVRSLHEMAAALKGGSSVAHKKAAHRQEVAILLVDLSPSMGTRDMAGQTRIEAVRDAIQSLMAYKALAWG